LQEIKLNPAIYYIGNKNKGRDLRQRDNRQRKMKNVVAIPNLRTGSNRLFMDKGTNPL
jgi:hypothetical protein